MHLKARFAPQLYSFLVQSEVVDILASNVAKQKRRVCGVQPRIPSKPPSVVPILQIDDLLRPAATDARCIDMRFGGDPLAERLYEPNKAV
jgi:hypothetical protein